MIKNWKLAVIWGILLWVLIFVEVSILMFGIPQNATLQNVLHFIILPVLVLFCGWMYFKEREGSAKEGVVLAIVWLVIMFILDLAVTVPLFIAPQAGGYGAGFKELFGNWIIYFGFLEVIVFAAIAGAVFSKK